MKNMLLVLMSFLSSTFCFAQQFEESVIRNNDLKNKLEEIGLNKFIDTDSAIQILSSWNKFPEIKKTNLDYLFVYQDPFYSDVPFRVFIPKNYRSDNATPLVLLLHGGVSGSDFQRAYESVHPTDNIFFDYLSKQGYIIVRPFADPSKKFDWAVNRFNMSAHYDQTNLTFNTISNVLIKLKEFLNIDDKKVFAFGHSDGSDGAFAFEIYRPSMFAGFVAYNSMLTNIFAYDIYLKNLLNRP